jgi:hypothetical protein
MGNLMYLVGMKRPLFVRPLSDAERQQLEAGLRRCQVLVSSARGEMAPQIARYLGCNDQTVRNAIGAFNHAGLASLSKGSSRPPTTRAAFPGEKAEQLRALLHQSPVPSTSPPICGLWNWPPK